MLLSNIPVSFEVSILIYIFILSCSYQELGFNSQVARLPNSNLGVVLLTNDHDYGRAITQIVKYHIFDKVLGLDPIDWSGRLAIPYFTPLTPVD